MRRFFFAAVSLSIFLVSCRPQTATPAPTNTTSTPTPIVSHASEIRFAFIGEPTDVNVWALFDERGASYANYALRSDYWPRLYYLAPPDLTFTPRAANGQPTYVTQEGDLFTSAVALRSDLKWTDGSPFTAEDVVFTVNTALKFELGFDWKAYYSPEYLARAEAIDASTVKFFFKQKPNVGIWQYGALQGPILQKAFWESKITNASALLPDNTLRASIADAQARIAQFQPIVDSLNLQFYVLQSQGKQSRELEADLKRNQGNLDSANNDLAKFLADYAAKVEAAHQALYAIDGQNEPTLGVWMPVGKEQDKWINSTNPDFPFERPNFDRAVYYSFSSEKDADKALEDNKVDMILRPNGKVPPSPSNIKLIKSNINGSVHYLVFNPSNNSALADPALRQALACMIWLPTRSMSVSMSGFVLQGNDFWRNPDAVTPCADLTDANLDLRLARAVKILKSAGYSWEVEPTNKASGEELVMPNGQSFPSIVLLSPSKEYDAMQSTEASLIETQAKFLGIPLTAEYVSPQDIRYKVLSSKKYDMAILGWQLSLYPGYLCEWFGAKGQFDYNEGKLRSECDALATESGLDVARQHVFEIQSILANDLPFIPLYAGVTYDAYRSLHYPFDTVLDGLNGLYGAPSFASPSP